MAYHELFHCERESCRVQQDLSVIRQVVDDAVQHPFEILGQELISLKSKYKIFIPWAIVDQSLMIGHCGLLETAPQQGVTNEDGNIFVLSQACENYSD